MNLPRFHVRDLNASPIALSEAEARHARRSRRLSAGDRVALFDGQGRQATGRILDAAGRRVTVALDHITLILRPKPALTLAFAIPKGPRQDLLVEKSTELGVAVLQPINSARSVADASAHRLEKWHRTAVEAAKQAGLAWLPDIRPILSLEQLLADAIRYDLTLIALSPANTSNRTTSVSEGPSPRPLPDIGSRASTATIHDPAIHPISDLFPTLRAADAVLALVGPEGGWTNGEVARALSARATPVSLGPNTLRIETAAVALAAALHALLTSPSTDASH